MMINMIGAAHPDYKGARMAKTVAVERKIVGLSGYARSGKDEIANVLVSEFGFRRYAFADKLRDCVYALNPVVSTGHERLNDFDRKYRRLQDVIDEFGWGGYKESKWGDEIRQLLQRMGTEVGRDIIGEDTWVKGLDETEGNIVVTDMRFPNEYERVKMNGGETWRVERPGITAVNAHISETAIDDQKFDYRIHNDGDLDDLRMIVTDLAKRRGF